MGPKSPQQKRTKLRQCHLVSITPARSADPCSSLVVVHMMLARAATAKFASAREAFNLLGLKAFAVWSAKRDSPSVRRVLMRAVAFVSVRLTVRSAYCGLNWTSTTVKSALSAVWGPKNATSTATRAKHACVRGIVATTMEKALRGSANRDVGSVSRIAMLAWSAVRRCGVDISVTHHVWINSTGQMVSLYGTNGGVRSVERASLTPAL